MMKAIYKQFVNPTGVMGWIVGTVMAYENRERNRWAVSIVNLQPTDKVLEIGFGPGVAIQFAVQQVTQGLVAGLDISAVMVKQAVNRNAKAVREGRVILKQGVAAQIPYDDGMFDKVYAVNSLHLWQNPAEGLCEVRRVLRPGGQVIIIQQPLKVVPDTEIEALKHNVINQLNEAGFSQFTSTHKPMSPAATVAVVGIK